MSVSNSLLNRFFNSKSDPNIVIKWLNEKSGTFRQKRSSLFVLHMGKLSKLCNNEDDEDEELDLYYGTEKTGSWPHGIECVISNMDFHWRLMATDIMSRSNRFMDNVFPHIFNITLKDKEPLTDVQKERVMKSVTCECLMTKVFSQGDVNSLEDIVDCLGIGVLDIKVDSFLIPYIDVLGKPGFMTCGGKEIKITDRLLFQYNEGLDAYLTSKGVCLPDENYVEKIRQEINGTMREEWFFVTNRELEKYEKALLKKKVMAAIPAMRGKEHNLKSNKHKL